VANPLSQLSCASSKQVIWHFHPPSKTNAQVNFLNFGAKRLTSVPGSHPVEKYERSSSSRLSNSVKSNPRRPWRSSGQISRVRSVVFCDSRTGPSSSKPQGTWEFSTSPAGTRSRCSSLQGQEMSRFRSWIPHLESSTKRRFKEGWWR